MWDLVPQPEIEPGPPAMGAQSLTHWTTREVPRKYLVNESEKQPGRKAEGKTCAEAEAARVFRLGP